jgi:hypothetical protein
MYPLVGLLEYTLNFLRSFIKFFHSGCTNLPSHQQWTVVSFCLHPYQHLLSLVFWIITIIPGWHLIVMLSAFPWWSAMLSSVSCTCCSFVCLVLRNVYNVYLDVLPDAFLSFFLFFFFLRFWRSLFWMSIPYKCTVYKYFILLAISSLCYFLCYAEGFSLM